MNPSEKRADQERHLKLFASLIAPVCALFWLGCAEEPGNGVQHPECPGCNVILISVDTLRADHLSCYDYERTTSPEICEFFASGIKFTQAISQSGWTAPAHASMFTGLYPGKHGVSYGPKIPRLTGHDTIFSLLRSHGYYTVALHGGGYVRPVIARSDLDVDRRISLRSDLAALFDEALAGNAASQPFFLFLHGYDMHTPYSPRKNLFLPVDRELSARARQNEFCRYEDLPDRSRRLRPESVPESREVQQYIEALYDSEIREVDESLGRFFAHLEKSELLDDTIVILTSDHGEEFWDHGSCEHVKTVYNELLRVPLFLRIPGSSARTSRSPVAASISILPTVLDVLALPIPPGIDGKSLLDDESRMIFSESQFHYDGEHRRHFSVVKDEFKLMLDANHGTAELYNLEADRREKQNLLGSPAEPNVQSLQYALDAFIARDTSDTASPVEMDEQTLRELRELGYID
jgi:arylsulfatase A-like enzyme